MRYQILTASRLEDLEVEVNAAICVGARLQGGIAIAPGGPHDARFAQAICWPTEVDAVPAPEEKRRKK